MIDGANNREKPGVVKWQERLKRRGKLEKKRMSRFMVASVQYGDKDFFVADVFSDSLSFHLDLLTDAGADWVEAVEAEIRLTDKVAAAVLHLGMDIDKAATAMRLGNSSRNSSMIESTCRSDGSWKPSSRRMMKNKCMSVWNAGMRKNGALPMELQGKSFHRRIAQTSSSETQSRKSGMARKNPIITACPRRINGLRIKSTVF